jgi:hypothetical protein
LEKKAYIQVNRVLNILKIPGLYTFAVEVRLFSEKHHEKFAPVDIYLPPPVNLMIMVDGTQHKEKPRSEETAGRRKKAQADKDRAFDRATQEQVTYNRLYRLSELDEHCFYNLLKEIV